MALLETDQYEVRHEPELYVLSGEAGWEPVYRHTLTDSLPSNNNRPPR